MLFSKICLTGGPCGGKTSTLKELKQKLSELRLSSIDYK